MSEFRQFYTLDTQVIQHKKAPAEISTGDYQYRDYSTWQKNWLQGEKLHHHLQYWQQHLHGTLPVLELPLDYPRQQQFGYTGGKHYSEIQSSLVEKLRNIALQQDITLYMVLLAAYYVFLYRHTNQKDLVIGTPIANRHHADTENIVGYFANTLALRIQLDGSMTFLQVLDLVKECCIEAYQHQDMPFEQLVKELNPERTVSHTAIYQSMFLYADGTQQLSAFEGITTKKIDIDSKVAHTDLSFEFTQLPNRFEFSVEYSDELFDETTAINFANRFIHLIGSIAEESESAISHLSLVNVEEKNRILDLNPPLSRFEDGLNIDKLLSRQCKLTPNSIAVRDNKRQLTFADLEKEVNELTVYLTNHYELKENGLVGLCVSRTADMLVCMLAILRSNCAYLPLDPAYPTDRIQFILKDANCQLLISEKRFAEQVKQFNGELIYLDTLTNILPSDSLLGMESSATDSKLAYSIYTSGSTGKPKGVLVSHQNVLNFLSSMAKSPGLKSENKLLAITTISFDIAVLELFLPLYCGATIVLADTETAADANRLIQMIEEENIDVMQATPATWNLLLAAGWTCKRPLKILCGGEAMSNALAAALTQQGHQLWNMYGPTETTVWSSIKLIADKSEANLIGKPIANTSLYVLSEDKQLQPLGVKGELYIGGAGVTLGYLNRNSLNKQRFVEIDLNLATRSAQGDLDQPVLTSPQRLYRTGDAARLNRNGNLEYIERIDNQIKLRGYRIELGEIENNIIHHPSIQQVACVVKHPSSTDARLYAYFIRLENADMAEIGLREFLASRLPSYMIPQNFVELKEFPKTPNGKIDRKVLVTMEDDLDHRARQSIANVATTEMESMVIKIWQDCLNISAIGTNDNFFDLGGHSLLSIQVIEAIKQKTNVQISAHEILMNTLGQIAKKCESTKVKPTRKKSFWQRLFARS